MQTGWDKNGENIFKIPQIYNNRVGFSNNKQENWQQHKNQNLNVDVVEKSFQTTSVSRYLQKRYNIIGDWSNEMWSSFWNSKKYMYYDLLQRPYFGKIKYYLSKIFVCTINLAKKCYLSIVTKI